MATKMIRQPSETPNVTNFDDFIPFRYAYGNQNGYVASRGQELSYTIDGNNFKINSGRIVLQGVEADIDANGESILVDTSITTRQYYTVYFKVNLSTNNCSIDYVSNTTNFPQIDVGDNLIANSAGIAKMELYHFVAESGIITEVEKLVKRIEYTEDILIKNCQNAIRKEDGTYTGFNMDKNGVLLCGDIIIPQEKILWSGTSTASSGTTQIIGLKESVKTGDSIEIIFSIDDDKQLSRTIVIGELEGGLYTFFLDGENYVRKWEDYYLMGNYMCWAYIGGTTFKFGSGAYTQLKVPSSGLVTTSTARQTYVKVYRVNKIIK